jgi:ligand-binding SRPBCC domain-containing protein
MPVLEFDTLVRAPLADVWAFHEDVAVALPALSPPAARVSVESADVPVKVGSRIVIRARGPLGVPLRWVARIVEHVPPGNEAGPDAALFVDEQESGPFAAWRHEHRFDSPTAGTTRLTDRVTYRARFGRLGALADRLFVRRQVVAMFRHRHAALALLFDPEAHAAVHSPA